MHGLINRAIECFVRDTYGEDRWGDVTRLAGLSFTGFEAMLRYDDYITENVLNATSEVLDRPQNEVLEDIGTYLVSHPNVEGLRRLLRFGGVNFVEFLHSLDDLSDRVRLAVSDLDLPRVELREHSLNHFSLICQSEIKGYGFVLLGLLRAMADDYGALAILEYQGGGQGVENISIMLIESSYSDGRLFELGARSA
ncbi:MAG: heme NO-binding domain-containing protein [Paracoccaceae bacterium]